MMLIRRSPAALARGGTAPAAAANTKIANVVKEGREGAKKRDTPRIIAGGARAGHSARARTRIVAGRPFY